MNIKKLNKKGKVEQDIVKQIVLDKMDSPDEAGQFQDSKEDLFGYIAMKKEGGLAFRFEDFNSSSVHEFVAEYFPELEDGLEDDDHTLYVALAKKRGDIDALYVTFYFNEIGKYSTALMNKYMDEFQDLMELDVDGDGIDSDIEGADMPKWAQKFAEEHGED